MKILVSSFTSGGTIEKILKNEKFDELILLSSNAFLKKAEEFIKLKKIKGVVAKINAFKIEPLMQVIGNIFLKYKNNGLVVNITEGNNLIAASLLSASYYFGFKTLTVTENSQIIELPTLSLMNLNHLNKSAKKWLKEIKENIINGEIELRDLSRGISSQRLTKPLKILERAGFIEKISSRTRSQEGMKVKLDLEEKEVSKRTITIKLTPLGNLYSRFMPQK